MDFRKIFLWSDSTITLQWIKTEPHTQPTFIANRIAVIQKLTPSCEWRNVPSQDNSADMVSRGQMPQEFLESQICKNGPHWLSQEERHWPAKIHVEVAPPKRSFIAAPINVKVVLERKNLLEKYSSMAKLQRHIAYLLRFVNNLKNKTKKCIGPLSEEELDSSARRIIELTQSAEFSKEITHLKNSEKIDDRSRLIPLNPFVDNQGILRVGRKVVHSELSYDQKQPILLPSNHHITRLLIREEHLRLKHAGAQVTLYSVYEHYWPLDGRKVRTPQSFRPFLNVGVDYCGPLYIKERRFQNRKRIKVYVAIYVCMATKAVHLELVSDLTTEAFIASLKRLFSRRGKSKSIYSDNGKNFVGANRELNELYQLLLSAEHNKNVQQFLINERITWHLIPPEAPHFGGLWEAAVKSFKHHLLRTIGDTLLTYEQLETCIIEIEAVLNSRPISPMSADPNVLRPLTPGHILVGGPLASIPQINLSDTPSNRLLAWEHTQKMREHFWKRWGSEYLNQLIVRSKWPLNSSHCIKVGSMVMIKEDEITPPLQWAVGRVIAVQPGEDGIIRSATIKTVKGEYKHGIKKLFPLPIESPVSTNE
ncbi:uncharacterized protein LOC117169816 [Belonocnema kinseyi]|uniref:uncharacterized protein LOC117169816 n=1 Tax=Belonocnema kinseyi TaxID=2817044 RepID=UPI00143DA871|nr:uncharacterized protein LOC117169816 [Belonocnema kinseyi]